MKKVKKLNLNLNKKIKVYHKQKDCIKLMQFVVFNHFICMKIRTTGPRPQEQPQFNTYVQVQPQGLPVGHNIVQSSHIPNQHANMPIAMVGVPPLPNTQGGTPYSIYDAAPQSNASLSANGMIFLNLYICLASI